jgi:hypothetical protein
VGFSASDLTVLLAIAAVLLSPVLAARRLNRQKAEFDGGRVEDRCPTCGYDRRGSGAVCPECGDETPRFRRVGLDPIKLQANWPASEIRPRDVEADESRLLLWTAPHSGLSYALVDQLRSRGVPAVCARIATPSDARDPAREFICVTVPGADFDRALCITETFARD